MKPWTQKARERKQICPECQRLVPRKDWKETLKRGHCPICFIAHRGVSGVGAGGSAERMRRLLKGETKMTSTPLDLFLREVECYDMNWFAEIGGHQARTELAQLRARLGVAERMAEAVRVWNNAKHDRENWKPVIGAIPPKKYMDDAKRANVLLSDVLAEWDALK